MNQFPDVRFHIRTFNSHNFIFCPSSHIARLYNLKWISFTFTSLLPRLFTFGKAKSLCLNTDIAPGPWIFAFFVGMNSVLFTDTGTHEEHVISENNSLLRTTFLNLMDSLDYSLPDSRARRLLITFSDWAISSLFALLVARFLEFQRKREKEREREGEKDCERLDCPIILRKVIQPDFSRYFFQRNTFSMLSLFIAFCITLWMKFHNSFYF